MTKGNNKFEMRQCRRDSCRFRFPVLCFTQSGDHCPRCGEKTERASAPFGEDTFLSELDYAQRPINIEALLDNIRSAYNVGSIFRTAEGAGISHIHLAGISPTPFHPKLRKTALGAEKRVLWTQHRNGLDAAHNLKDLGYRLIGLENCSNAKSLFEMSFTDNLDGSISIIVGNEVAGIDPSILEICDDIIAVPMMGNKHSLNVVVAFGIAVYFLQFDKYSSVS